MKPIYWDETPPCRGVYVGISDGTLTHYAPIGRRSVRAMAADYAADYSFNEPGDVDIVAMVYDQDGERTDSATFTIRSENGRTGRLID